MSTITLTPSAAGGHTFGKTATMSEKYDGIQGRWDGTHLSTRDGNIIHAPTWWTKRLPKGKRVVGELWIGRNTFSELQSIVTRKTPDDRWRRVRFMVFEGEASGENVETIRQIPVRDSAHVRQFAAEIIRQGGEGAVVVDGGDVVKIKAVEDRGAVVVGHIEGRGRLRGVLGAFTVQDGPILFNLGAGVSDAVRKNPPKIGALLTYQFRGWTAGGKPRFPVFVRERIAA